MHNTLPQTGPFSGASSFLHVQRQTCRLMFPRSTVRWWQRAAGRSVDVILLHMVVIFCYLIFCVLLYFLTCTMSLSSRSKNRYCSDLRGKERRGRPKGPHPTSSPLPPLRVFSPGRMESQKITIANRYLCVLCLYCLPHRP